MTFLIVAKLLFLGKKGTSPKIKFRKLNPSTTVLLVVIQSYRNWICIKTSHQTGIKNPIKATGLKTKRIKTPVLRISCMQG